LAGKIAGMVRSEPISAMIAVRIMSPRWFQAANEWDKL
jgi:hypothetical protein